MLADRRSLQQGAEMVTILISPLFKPRPPFELHMMDTTLPGWVGPLRRALLQLRMSCYFTSSGTALTYEFEPQRRTTILSACQRNCSPYNSNSVVYQECVIKRHPDCNL